MNATHMLRYAPVMRVAKDGQFDLLARGEHSEGAEQLTQALAIFRELEQQADVDRIEAGLAKLG